MDSSHADEALPLRIMRQIDVLCDEFESALRHGGGICIAPYVEGVEPAGRDMLLKELSLLALDRLHKDGASDPLGSLLDANPTLREALGGITHSSAEPLTIHMDGGSVDRGKSSGLAVLCPHCHSKIEMVVDASLVDIGCPCCGGNFSLVSDADATRDATALTKIAHFELIDRLGMGEFGTVWKARDTMLDRTVALKIPRREKLDAPSIEKFMREAQAAARLRHPNIVSTHEVGRHGDTLYIVIDYIRGISLADVIADHRLGIRESVMIVLKLADALEHAHRSSVIHRDLKPSNILIDDQGEPHLMDFGLAKRKDAEITITMDGAILGTPAYMSPEQARGEGARVDGRSDIYSLGVILFQLLTGELPFRGSVRVLLQKVIHDDPPGPRTLDSHVPKDLDTICLKCLEKDRAGRYATAGDLAADLRRWMAGEPIAARRIGAVGRTLRWARRNPAISLLIAATITTLVAATSSSSYFAWRATDSLYVSLLQEIRLTREVRQQGYGEEVRKLVERARNLPTNRVDKDDLRRQLVLTMGDFVAYPPRVITPTDGKVTAFRLDNDGRQVFAGLNSGRVVAYDVSTGKAGAELNGSNVQVLAMALSAQGDRLIVADQKGTVRVWRAVDGTWEIERTLELGESPRWVSLSGHGELAAWLKEHAFDIWDVTAGTKLLSLPTESDWSMRNAAFDIAGKRIVAGYLDEDAERVGWAMWDLDTLQRREVDMPALGSTYGNGIDLAGADNRMAIGFDEALLVYELKDFEHTNLVGIDSTKAVAFSPTHPILAALNIRGRITMWNSATNRQIATLYHPTMGPGLNGLSFSADGGRLAASNADSIQIWDIGVADERTVMSGHNGGIPCAVFRPDGRLLVTGAKDDKLRFWDPATGQQLSEPVDLGEEVQTLAFSGDGRLLAVGCMGNREDVPHLRLIDVASREVIYAAENILGKVFSVDWVEAPDGRYLAGSGMQGAALWKVHPGPPVRLENVYKTPGEWCEATALGRGARLMVWAHKERQLKARDVVAGRDLPLDAPEMQQGWHGLTFLPDGKSILYIANTGVAEVWNIEKNRHEVSFGEPGTFGAPQISLSPDGKLFAALLQEDTVSVWHRPTGKHVFTLRPATAAVWSLAWDPSGQHLAVGQTDGGLSVWHLPRIQQKLAQFDLRWSNDDSEQEH